jgi:hypothetical protein
MPMRVVGATTGLVGAVVSVVPVAGNKVDAALETVDKTIDTAADRVDDVPLIIIIMRICWDLNINKMMFLLEFLS